MIHPIANNRRNLLLYGIFWGLIALMHGYFIFHFYDASIYLSVADALLYNLLFGLLGLGLWFAVKFSQMETNNTGNLILNHLAAVSVTLVLMLLFGYYSMKTIPFFSDGYIDFFNLTLIWRVITGVMEYILLILVYYLIMYYNNFKEKFTQEAAMKTNVKIAELNVLKSQINPHFLFNSLNSISALTLSEGDKAREMIRKLSDFLRFSISEKPDAIRKFSEEIDNIRKYLDIEKVRFEDRLHVHTDISDKCGDALIPSLILQPIVENAVKHGVNESLDTVQVSIVADCFQGYLKVQIENDIETSQPGRPGTGLGLQNIKERLKLLFGREDLMLISQDHSKYSVTITFPQNIIANADNNH